MKGTKGYQGVMETMYISTLERSVEMKRFESGPNSTYCPDGACVPVPDAHSSDTLGLCVVGLLWLEERTMQVTSSGGG